MPPPPAAAHLHRGSVLFAALGSELCCLMLIRTPNPSCLSLHASMHVLGLLSSCVSLCMSITG
eukprot:12765649-Alexandrium_andersonii.AAC.2